METYDLPIVAVFLVYAVLLCIVRVGTPSAGVVVYLATLLVIRCAGPAGEVRGWQDM